MQLGFLRGIPVDSRRWVAFKVEERHFNLGIGLLLMGMVMLAVFGMILSVRIIVGQRILASRRPRCRPRNHQILRLHAR
jgi:hypothetical protein